MSSPLSIFTDTMRIEITSAAPNLNNVITIADLKEHLRVTHTAEDDLIEALRAAACTYVEGYCNTKMQSTNATAWLSGFYRSAFPVGPVSDVEQVRYQNTSSTADDDLQTLSTAKWYAEYNTQPAVIDFIQPPVPYEYSHLPVQIDFSYGYSSAPEPMVHAVRLLVAHLYENRQQVVDRQSVQIQMGIHALLSQYRHIVQP